MAAMIAQGGKAKFSGNLPGSPFASRPGLDGSAEYVGARVGRFGAGGVPARQEIEPVSLLKLAEAEARP